MSMKTKFYNIILLKIGQDKLKGKNVNKYAFELNWGY